MQLFNTDILRMFYPNAPLDTDMASKEQGNTLPNAESPEILFLAPS